MNKITFHLILKNGVLVKIIFATKLAFLLMLFVSIARANESTGLVRIVNISNWVGTENFPKEELFVKTDQATLTNPAGCTKLDGYHLNSASTISRTILLAALTSNSDVGLNIGSGICASNGRPVIVQVGIHQ